jgi:hypothetical protein
MTEVIMIKGQPFNFAIVGHCIRTKTNNVR